MTLRQESLASLNAARPVTALALVMLLALPGCSSEPKSSLQGYVEGEFVLAAAPAGGTLVKLNVHRGDSAAPGTTLFILESGSEEAARREAEQRVRGAEQRLANLRAGRRAPEVDVVRAQAEQAAAARKLSNTQLAQQERLFAGGYISQSAIDQARANHERDMARVAEAEAQGRVAQLTLGRDAEIRAATADVEAARAALAQGDWRLGQRRVNASGNAANASPMLVQDTYYNEGEWVPAGRPVVSLLPSGNVKVRFFVPETRVATVQVGQAVSIGCDGCGAAMNGKVTFISRQSEYTPPIIYSKESRAKLVYLVEARTSPEDAKRLRPGLPVDVTLTGASPASPPVPQTSGPPATR
jgi:HlyD family secretion protein